tara:strand:- start:71 stop:484 length:414 start_codon:yes stop_codon:yes gene_type:complete
MKKFFSTIIVTLLICNISFAKTVVLYCVDEKLIGLDGEDQYLKTKSYRNLKFKLKLDTNKKMISSKELGGGFDKPDMIKCRFWPAFGKYDAMLECMSLGYNIVINTDNYKYTRSRGYGYAFGSNDDIGIGYGKCEEF